MQEWTRIPWRAVVLFALLNPLNAQAQNPPQMRTRLLTSLTNQEVEEYLGRNDIIFVPVGPTEVHGRWPLDCEYVLPEAYAIKLAEKADGLVLPNLSFVYPGATFVGKGTVQSTSSEEIPYYKMIVRSLMRQGFKRIIFLTGHGPAPMTINPVVREMFVETNISPYYLDVQKAAGEDARPPQAAGPAANAAGAQRPAGPQGMELAMYGAYSIVGRLEDIPLKLETKAPESRVTDSSLQVLSRNSMQGGFGYFYADAVDHGGVAAGNLTAAQRAEFAKQGIAQIEATVARVPILEVVQAIRDHNRFQQTTMKEKYGELFPANKK